MLPASQSKQPALLTLSIGNSARHLYPRRLMPSGADIRPESGPMAEVMAKRIIEMAFRSGV
jgi:hypothetical protein